MALYYIVQTPDKVLIRGLSTDTKPASPGTDWVFIEYDTGTIYKVVSGAWQRTLVPAEECAPTSDQIIAANTTKLVVDSYDIINTYTLEILGYFEIT